MIALLTRLASYLAGKAVAAATNPWTWILLAIILATAGFSRWQGKRIADAKAELEAERACEVDTRCGKRLQAIATEREKQALINAKVSADVVSNYESELDRLRNRPARIRTIRVCTDTDPGHVPVPGATRAADGTGAARGVVHGSASEDDLTRLAADADEVAARLRALQAWNESIASQTTSTQPTR